MNVIINGEKTEIAPETTVEDHLKHLDLNLDTVVVEADGLILKQEEYATLMLKDGMVLELIRFIGGG